jgi:hypothetical protein
MGMENDTQFTTPPPNRPPEPAAYPPISNLEHPKLPVKAISNPIPLQLTEAPSLPRVKAAAAAAAAAAAKLASSYHNTVLEPKVNRLDRIKDMDLDREEAFAQVYLLPSPYVEAFEDHSAGLVFVDNNDRLVLADILKSTPAARIDKWHSRCRGAVLLEVEGRKVSSAKEVHEILKNLKERDFRKCRITLAHLEIKHSLTSKGLPQLHIDQLNTRFIMNLDHIVKHQAQKIISGGGGSNTGSFQSSHEENC